MQKIIALLTDFGVRDAYVGIMKGVMAGISPDVRLIDITHNVDPQHVRQAAFILRNSYHYFPKGTVFLAVVDPGVGSMRKPIAACAGGYAFVGPDNGVLTYTLDLLGKADSVELQNTKYWLPEVSQTFHGRDIFAPVAAHLVEGVSLHELGDPLSHITRLPRPELTIQGKRVVGEVMHIDHFGNIITSIGYLYWTEEERLILRPAFNDQSPEILIESTNSLVRVHGQTIYTVRAAYGDAMRGDWLALVGSNGYLEIAVNQGNAAERLDVIVGDQVELKIGDIDATISD